MFQRHDQCGVLCWPFLVSAKKLYLQQQVLSLFTLVVNLTVLKREEVEEKGGVNIVTFNY